MDTLPQRECPLLLGWISKWILLSHPLQMPILPVVWRTTKGTLFMGRCLALKCLKWGCWNPTSDREHLLTPMYSYRFPGDAFPYSRMSPSSHTQLSKGGPSHSCACFAYPCNVLKALVEVRLYSSGVFCLRQYFQQLIIWKEVEPTNTERGMRRGSVYCSSKG